MVDTRTTTTQVALNGTNFPTWKLQMRMVLMKQGVWRIVEGTEQAPDEEDVALLRKFNDRRDKALASIVLAVEPNLLYLLGDPQDPQQVWLQLCNQFQKKTWANKLALRRKLYGLRLKDKEPVQDHVKAMIEIFDELAVIGEAVEEEDRVVHILASLPESFSMLVTALEANTEVPRLEVVTERLLNEERKMKEKLNMSTSQNEGHNPGENALFTNTNFKNKLCFYCGETGHIKRFCEKLKKKIEQQQQQQSEKQEDSKRPEIANFSFCANRRKADSYTSSDDECIALVSEVISRKGCKWVVDSAATSHMCNDKSKFKNLRKLEQSQRVKVGNGQYTEASYEGTVILRVRTGRKVQKLKLSKVLFVPELMYNLLSVSRAVELRKRMEFNRNGCQIIDIESKEVIVSAHKVGNLYHLDCIAEKEQRDENDIGLKEMRKALHSVKENNFMEEMLNRLTHIEEDKMKMNARLRSVENFNNESCAFKEESDKNQLRNDSFQEDSHFKKDSFQEDSQLRRDSFQEDSQIRNVNIQELSKNNKEQSNEKQMQFCSTSKLLGLSNMSITNRQGYLMSLLFKDYSSDKLIETETSMPDNDLD